MREERSISISGALRSAAIQLGQRVLCYVLHGMEEKGVLLSFDELLIGILGGEASTVLIWVHTLQGIASIAQACAALRHHPGELLDSIIADMEARPSEYERDDWTAVVWALTRLARSPGHLYARLAQEVSRVTRGLGCVDVRTL